MQCAKSIYDHLAAIQHPISEDHLANTILKGLDAPYDALVCTINTTQQFLSFDDLFSLLLSEEMQLKPASAMSSPNSVEDSPSALYSSRGHNLFRGSGRGHGSFRGRG